MPRGVGVRVPSSAQYAKIAQLVEHNLAKVGVAGSNPVFRSTPALVVELVDTQDLKSCASFGVRVQVPPGVQADFQRFSSLFKRAFFMPKNLGYNISNIIVVKFSFSALLLFPFVLYLQNSIGLKNYKRSGLNVILLLKFEIDTIAEADVSGDY